MYYPSRKVPSSNNQIKMTSESSREVPLAATAAVFVPGTPFRTSAVQTQATVGPQLLNYTILETAPCSPGGLPTHTTKVRFDEITSDIILGPAILKGLWILEPWVYYFVMMLRL